MVGPVYSTTAVVIVCNCGAPTTSAGSLSSNDREQRPSAAPVARLPDHERRCLERIERRIGFRRFVGSAVAPTVVVSHASRRPQNARRRTSHHDAWRTRALGKRPSRIASG
jgi:hypothetical protein